MERIRNCCSGVWSALSRKKLLDIQRLQDTELRRCLSVIDLTALGVGTTLGAGIYVLTGQVAKTQTGPAIVISFLIAAFASFLAGICYAEFAARVPKAGSAYVYSYVSVGELWAFVIGWNMILENMIGAASSGKAWSQFLDSLFNDTIRTSIEAGVGKMDVAWLDSYPDFLAMGLLLVATVLVCVGVKISSSINLVFTIINLIVIVCIIGVGLFYSDIHNWTHSPHGFFPFKFRGVLAGAATCFYSFVGFDTIATSGEESTNPTRHVPLAIVVTLIVCLVAYVGVSAVLTMMVPWTALADTAALPKVFAQRGVIGAEYVIAVGGLCGLTASMMGSIFPLPRSIYAMAQDGLVFRWLGHVARVTDTPAVAAVLSGVIVAVCALLFDLNSLIEMMSIGTLMAYTLVAVSVLVLHYQRERVGLTADDMEGPGAVGVVPGVGTTLDGVGLGVGRVMSNGVSCERISLSEDTGLLRVGEGSNRVRYVPTNTTTVVKRVKPPQDSDEEQPTPTPPPPQNGIPVTVAPESNPTRPTSPLPPRLREASVVEEYRAKVQQQQQLEQQQRQQQLEQQQQQQRQRHLSSAEEEQERRSATGHTSHGHVQPGTGNGIFPCGGDAAGDPTDHSRRVVIACVTVLVIVWSSLCVITVYGEDHLLAGDWWALSLVFVLVFVVLLLMALIARQPRNRARLNFTTPFVPFLPLVSVMINIYLMITLSATTWVRFAVWMALGFIIYFGYGVWHSKERRADDQEVILYDVSDKDNLVVDGVYR